MKQKNYFLWLSGIIIIIFIIQIIIPGFTDLFILDDRANNLEIWRFVTSIFLHGSITHLLYNLVALLFFGIVLEKLIGSKKFLFIFLLSGIIANLIAINYYDSSLGASGAIYGLIGVITILAPFIMVWAFGLIMPISIAAVIWIIADILRSLGAFGPTNIGSIAHLSGIAIGIIYGVYLRVKKKKENNPAKSGGVRQSKGGWAGQNPHNNQKITINDSDFKIWEDKFMK